MYSGVHNRLKRSKEVYDRLKRSKEVHDHLKRYKEVQNRLKRYKEVHDLGVSLCNSCCLPNSHPV
ncbi:hypothetical protein J6590_085665 [Homalodisca vitripennis]|nr:hypothetical protein J6590_085665 [Homalodisca vitripennis]